MKALMIMTTTPKRKEAQKIAKALLAEHLAACVQILGPLESTYHWEGAVETTTEWLCLIKTREELFARAEACIRQNHSYQTPEIIAFPINNASNEYWEWLKSCTALSSSQQKAETPLVE